MEKTSSRKVFICFVSISLLLLTSGFQTMVAGANEIGRPIGEMISPGEAKFEVRENVWKDAEPSSFPIFQGVRIKTEKGVSMITLENNGQIEMGSNSLLSFDRNDQIRLSQGTINFRFPSTAEVSVNVGNLTVMKYRPLHASKNPSAVFQGSEEAIGSISVHPNGSITVESIRGSFSVVNQEHAVLAALSSKDTITIPSIAVKNPSRMILRGAPVIGTVPGVVASDPEGHGNPPPHFPFPPFPFRPRPPCPVCR